MVVLETGAALAFVLPQKTINLKGAGELDHLNGRLFIDNAISTSSYREVN